MHNQGEYVLYKSTELPFEVRILLTTCVIGKHTASCNCGVSARAGDDVFFLNRCNGKTKESMLLNDPITKNFRIFKKGRRQYTVVFPHGAKLIIWLEKNKKLKASNNKSKLINVFLRPSPADWQKTRGLCGIYDGDQSNDFTDLDGNALSLTEKQIEEYTRPWATIWRIESGFQFLGVNADPSLTQIENSCPGSGSSEQCTCNLDDLVETCELALETEITTDANIIQTGTKRRKRAVGNPFAELNIDPTATPVLAVFPTPINGITYEQANETCTNAFSGAAFTETCINLLGEDELKTDIANCINDIKIDDDLNSEFVQTALNAMSAKCEEVATGGTNNTLINSIKDVTCPSQCSGHGSCNNGTCECDDGFRDEDCSIDITVPPPVESLSTTVCQSTIEDACASVTIIGDDFVEGAVCHLEIVQATETGINKAGSTVKSVPATLISSEEVTCNLTESGSLPLHTVLISVSNNGEVTSGSDQYLYIAHNPVCYACSQQSQKEGTCQKEKASCHVNGVCYRPLEPSRENACYFCDVYTGQMIYNVSENCPASSTTEEPYNVNEKARKANDSLVIGLSAGAAGLVLVVVVIIAMVMTLRYMKMKSKNSDTKDLTHRSSSRSSAEDGEGFGELAYPAFGNYGYQGYPVQGYPAMYLEAPQDVFVNNIPKRHSSRHSDPTRDSNDRGDHRRSERHREDYYDNRA